MQHAVERRAVVALERMNALFKNRETKKTYWALVDQKPARNEDTLVHWLVKDEKKNKTTAYKKEHPEGSRSELKYKVIGYQSGLYLIEVNPITGRPHQIRVQLASMGCPIVGDVKYGFDQPNSDASICLHSRALRFVHPVKKEPVYITAMLPKNHFWKAFS